MQIKYHPKGMSNVELIEFAQLEAKHHARSVSEAEVYGAGKYLRKYGFYPNFLPIRVYITHGPSQWDFVENRLFPPHHNFNGFFSDRLVLDFRKRSDKKAFKIISPFAYCRRVNNIQQSPDAKGSLFFFAHSTKWIDFETDNNKVLEMINKLPVEFFPISVCMYYDDILKGRHKFFINQGIPVFTAGNWKNPCFIDNFYEILRNFKYSISNSIGSYIYYSVDLNIPFSIIDAKPKLVENELIKDYLRDEYFLNYQQSQRNYSLFKGEFISITQDQKDIATEELGMKDGISRFKFSILLYKSYFKYAFNLLISFLKKKFKIFQWFFQK